MAGLRKQSNKPALGRGRVLAYATPNISDIIFYIDADSRLANYNEPEYGSAYVGPGGEFPSHRLVHISAADEEGMVKWVYCAERANQGAYNFHHVHPSGSDGGYPFYTRTYVVPRADHPKYFGTYDTHYVAGSTALNQCTHYSPPDAGDEISLEGAGVNLTVTFDTAATVSNSIIFTTPLTVAEAALSLSEFISNSPASVAGVTFYDRDTDVESYLSAAPSALNSPFVIIKSLSEGEAWNSVACTSSSPNATFSYPTLINGSDTEGSPYPLNVSSAGDEPTTSALDIVLRPVGTVEGKPSYATFDGEWVSEANSVGQWVIYRTSNALDGYLTSESPDTPEGVVSWVSINGGGALTVDIEAYEGEEYLEPGAADPDLSFHPEFEGYQFTSLKTTRIGEKELDSLFIVVERKFEKLCAQEGSRINPVTGECEPFTVEVLPNTSEELVCSPVDAETGVGSTITPINCDFSRKTTGVLRPFPKRIFTTYINYGWPAVLGSIDIDAWKLKNGSFRYFPRVFYKRNAYNGPTRATVTQQWFKDPPPAGVVPKAYAMHPTTFQYTSPFFSINTGPCLHGCTWATCDIGNSDPVWGLNDNTLKSSPATNYTDWPLKLTISSKLAPAQHGYVLTTVELSRPEIGPEDEAIPGTYESMLEGWTSSSSCP